MIIYEFLALRVVNDSGVASAVYELTDGIQFALASYAPGVTRKRPATLGGQSEHGEVVDSLAVYALGDTAARAVANAETLAGVLEQAGRWADGENVPAVYLAARVQGGTAGTLQAMCLGPTPDSPPLTIDPEYDVVEACPGKWVQRVEAQVRRRGLWYGETISTVGPLTFTGATGVSSQFATRSQARTPIASLLRLSTTTAVPAAEVLAETVLIVSGGSTAGAIDIASLGNDNLPPTGFTQVNDAANLPQQGTFVLRFSPAVANPATSDPYPVSINNGTDLTVALFATLRANTVSSAVSFLITPRIIVGAGATFTGRPVEVQASTTSTRVIPLGLIPLPYVNVNASASVTLTVQAIGGTGVTLDLDTLAVASLTNQTAIITIPQVTLGASLSGDVYIVVDPGDLQGTLGEPIGTGGGAVAGGVAVRRPTVYAVDRSGGVLIDPQPLSYLGTLPQCDDTVVSALWLSVNPPYWEYAPATARVSHALTFSRRLAYRTPQ